MSKISADIYGMLSYYPIVFFLTKAFVILIALAVIGYIIDILSNISDFYKEKTNYLKFQQSNIKRPLTLNEQLNATNLLLDTIDDLVAYEIDEVLKTYAHLGQPYDIKKMDRDIKTVSETIFNAVKSNVYQSEDLILSSEYVIKYITQKSSSTFLLKTLNYNTSLTRQTYEDNE